MTLPADWRFLDRSVYLTPSETLVLSDLHLGRARTAGIAMPISSADECIARLDPILERLKPRTVVLAGDILDAFSTVPRGVENQFSAVCDAIENRGATVVPLAGNHDTMLAELYDQPVDATYRVGETLICHGHELPDDEATRYLIGHEHPAIRIEGVKRPCYLWGPGPNNSDLLVLPAVSSRSRGTVMNRRTRADCDSPFLGGASLDEFQPIVRDEDDDATLPFPPLGELRPFL